MTNWTQFVDTTADHFRGGTRHAVNQFFTEGGTSCYVSAPAITTMRPRRAPYRGNGDDYAADATPARRSESGHQSRQLERPSLGRSRDARKIRCTSSGSPSGQGQRRSTRGIDYANVIGGERQFQYTGVGHQGRRSCRRSAVVVNDLPDAGSAVIGIGSGLSPIEQQASTFLLVIRTARSPTRSPASPWPTWSARSTRSVVHQCREPAADDHQTLRHTSAILNDRNVGVARPTLSVTDLWPASVDAADGTDANTFRLTISRERRHSNVRHHDRQ